MSLTTSTRPLSDSGGIIESRSDTRLKIDGLTVAHCASTGDHPRCAGHTLNLVSGYVLVETTTYHGGPGQRARIVREDRAAFEGATSYGDCMKAVAALREVQKLYPASEGVSRYVVSDMVFDCGHRG